jgi:4'-phosphopantetheinyl transferase
VRGPRGDLPRAVAFASIRRMQMLPAPDRVQAWDEANVHVWWFTTPDDEAAPRQRRARLDRLLRDVLSRYLDLAPEQLRFGREPQGRPFLIGGGPDFNLSDTRGGTVIAVAAQPRIGIDLERIDRQLPHRRLAERYFAAAEREVLEAMPDEEARRAFLQVWTAKESSCKSTGTGIYGQLDRWSFDPTHVVPTLLGLPEAAAPASRWHHLRLQPAPGYTAVIACDGWRPQVIGFAA